MHQVRCIFCMRCPGQITEPGRFMRSVWRVCSRQVVVLWQKKERRARHAATAGNKKRAGCHSVNGEGNVTGSRRGPPRLRCPVKDTVKNYAAFHVSTFADDDGSGNESGNFPFSLVSPLLCVRAKRPGNWSIQILDKRDRVSFVFCRLSRVFLTRCRRYLRVREGENFGK